jgi:hypothetical protein
MTYSYAKHSFLVRLENLKRGDHSGEVGLDERIILGWESVDWIHLAKDRDQWRTLVNTVMNLWVT